MKISDKCIDIIKEFEGYHDALPDGRCKAYQRRYHGKLDKPTIGWGCTEGVEMGMVWTREEAEAGLRRELAKHEAAVARLTTVDLNQNEFDGLVSFSYNIGSHALANSTLLRKLNAGDREGAARQFQRWNKSGGGVVPGLVRRRAAEAALFLKPVEPVPADYMPQTVAPAPEAPGKAATATGAATVAGGGAAVLAPSLPDVAPLEGWLGVVGKAVVQPPVVLAIIGVVAAFVFIPRRKA